MVQRRRASSAASKPGAFADLLVVDGDPLRNIDLLGGQGERIVAHHEERRATQDTLN